MKWPRVTLVLLLGFAVSTSPPASAQSSDNGNVGEKLVNLRMAQERMTRAARLSPARTAAISESTWIGHSIQTIVPGDPSTYSYGPFHVGRGLNRPSLAGGTPAKNNSGFWDWDRFNADESDSLQGWWPMRRAYSKIDGPSNDVQRPWLCAEMGNQGCYATNSPGSRNGGPYGKKNFGVLGYWHIDPGNTVAIVPGTNAIAGTNPISPAWAPLDGTRSAWCGLRAHGDLVVSDAIMGNPYNVRVLEYNGNNGGSLSQGTAK